MTPEQVDSRFYDFVHFEASEIAPDVKEVTIDEAGVVFRIAPHWAATTEELTQDRDDLEVVDVEINGIVHKIAHKGLVISPPFKKSKNSGTWYYAVSESRRPAVYIQGLEPDIYSSHHRHGERREQIIRLFGDCSVRINGVDYRMSERGDLRFQLKNWHQVYTEGLPAVNCLIINGPGDCQDMSDHEPHPESLS